MKSSIQRPPMGKQLGAGYVLAEGHIRMILLQERTDYRTFAEVPGLGQGRILTAEDRVVRVADRHGKTGFVSRRVEKVRSVLVMGKRATTW